ncbi:MAG: flagellar hook-basal body protein [Proteobacteria bacterium]|nr:flagellar hook-basal body protein [Pseudomonadota bacterium]
MLKGIYRTLAGKYVTERRMEMVTNNIANALTPGYKSSRPLLNTSRDETAQRNDNPAAAAHINALDSYINFADAPLIETGNRLDLGIEGDGFFVVSVNGQNMYTINGQFTLNSEKKLVTLDGYSVMGDGGEITLDGKDVKIESDGTIYVDKSLTGKIKVVSFEEKKGLKNYGRSLFVNTNPNNAEAIPEKYSVKQGYYEASNVDVMREMIEMMSTLRTYESYSKVDQFFSDMIGKLINIGR